MLEHVFSIFSNFEGLSFHDACNDYFPSVFHGMGKINILTLLNVVYNSEAITLVAL